VEEPGKRETPTERTPSWKGQPSTPLPEGNHGRDHSDRQGKKGLVQGRPGFKRFLQDKREGESSEEGEAITLSLVKKEARKGPHNILTWGEGIARRRERKG